MKWALYSPYLPTTNKLLHGYKHMDKMHQYGGSPVGNLATNWLEIWWLIGMEFISSSAGDV
jgi:hypothetical protein